MDNTYFYKNLAERLNKAYGKTTQKFNAFEQMINMINWDCVFEADGEIYYQLGEFTLMVENIDPFKEAWKPSIIFGTFFKELGWM